MGGEVSTESDKSGWRVLQIMKNSPCGDKGLVAYFHVLTHVNGKRVTKAESSLFSLIQHGQLTKLSFVNFATGGRLEMEVVPNRDWGGEGLLGLVIRHQDMENADLDTVHVLDVYPGSPAAAAGLIPYRDYLLGTSERAFRGWDELDWFLEKYDNQPTQMVVFNSSTFQVREVTITPSKSWGGKGSLGCDVGIGYLHRLPLDQGKEGQSSAPINNTLPESTPVPSRTNLETPSNANPFLNFVPSLPSRPFAEPASSSFAQPSSPPFDGSSLASSQIPSAASSSSSSSGLAPPGYTPQTFSGTPVPSGFATSSFPQSTFAQPNVSQPLPSSQLPSFPAHAYAAFPQSAQSMQRPLAQFQPGTTAQQLPSHN